MVSPLTRDQILMGSPLRRPGTSKVVCAALIGILVFATIVNLALLAGLGADVLSVFDRALARSTALASVPLSVLWFLDRRERESPLLFASAFLWGGCIATGLALPFNTAVLHFADVWVREHPQLMQVLGPDATILLAAPISAPIVEEIAKALGVLLIFWLLRAEFDNMRDGIVYGGLVGLGFNWFEAALYVAQGYAEFGTPPYGAQLGARYALFGFGGHALFTGLFGAFLGLGLQSRHTWVRYLAPPTGLVLAIYGLNDSPVGLAAYLLDHGDHDGQPAAAVVAALNRTSSATGELTRDEILDNITLYWLTNTGVSASRLYWEYKGGFFNPKGVKIPVAVTVFPGEQYQAPRSWTERAYPKLIYYNKVDKGGHFAAWEQPQLFASELRAAFGSVR